MADHTPWLKEKLLQHLLGRLHQPGVVRFPMVQTMVARTERMIETPALQRNLAQRWQNTVDLRQENLPLVYAQPAQSRGVVDNPGPEKSRPVLPKVQATTLAPDADKPALVIPGSRAAVGSAVTKSKNPVAITSSPVVPVQTRPNNQNRPAKQRASGPEDSAGEQTQTRLGINQTKQKDLSVIESEETPLAGVPSVTNSPLSVVNLSRETKLPLPIVRARQTSAPPEPEMTFPQSDPPKVGPSTPQDKADGPSRSVVKPKPSSGQGQNNAGGASKGKAGHSPRQASPPLASATVSAVPTPLPLPVKKANSVGLKTPVHSIGLQGVTSSPPTLPLVQAMATRPKNIRPDLPLPSPGGSPLKPQPARAQGLLASQPRPMVPARPAAQSGGIIQRASDPAATDSKPVETGVAAPDIEEIANVVLDKIENKIELELERRGM